jgi:Flp pilus assembly protein TadG
MSRYFATLRRLAEDRSGAIALIFGLMLLPLIAVVGTAIDYARLEQFKSQLQGVVDAAALAGATAYVDATANTTATTVATNYFNSSSGQLAGQVGSPSVSVTSASITVNGQSGYGVTVQSTGQIASTFLQIFSPTLSVSATAVAVNPIVTVTFDIGGWFSSAADQNTIFWYQVPSDGSVPSSIPTSQQISTNATGVTNPSSVSVSASSTAKLGFALQNITGGVYAYGPNGYGAAQGSTHWFYSQVSNISSSVYPNSPNGDCSLGTVAVSTQTYPTNSTPLNGICTSSVAPSLQGGASCQQMNSQLSSGQVLRFFWNDMGGTKDDLDYNDAEYNVSCSGSNSSPTAPYLAE